MKLTLLVLMTFATATAAISSNAFATPAAATKTQELKVSTPLKDMVDELAVEWNDGNISTGSTKVSVVKITSTLPEDKAGWQTLVTELFKEKFEYFVEEKLTAKVKLRISSAPLSLAKDVEAATKAVAESNAYNTDNEETMSGIRAQVVKIVAALGDAKDVQFLSIKTRVMSDVTESMRSIRIHTFVNTSDGTAISIFTIEGTM